MIGDEKRSQEEFEQDSQLDSESNSNADINISAEPENELPLLNATVLVYVFVGIIAVFAMTIVINGFIFRYTTEIKTGYYLSILVSNFLFLMVIIVTKIVKKLSWSSLGWNKTNFFRSFKSVFKVWAIIWLAHIMYLFIIFAMGVTPPENALYELLEKPTLLLLLANIFLIAVVAPIIEETLFRGLLFPGLRNYFGLWTAIIISAAIFSALHFEIIGFFPRFALGIGLGYLYVKMGSIYPSIGLHSLNNLIAVLIVSSTS